MHNTRIERLWYDVTHGFGLKWKNFFLDLEAYCGLNPTIPSHIWLLHHLFLHRINEDAQEWAHSWNNHKLSLKGERRRTPHDIFFFSMIQDGPRGMQHLPTPPDVPLDDPATYGIGWDVADNTRLMTHLIENNPQDWDQH